MANRKEQKEGRGSHDGNLETMTEEQQSLQQGCCTQRRSGGEEWKRKIILPALFS